MNAILQTYRCLLADVARLSGFLEIRGLDIDLQWCLKEAPLLEKHVLEQLELDGGADMLHHLHVFPKQLRRLVAASVLDPEKLRYLRQLLLFCYKASVPHEPATTTAAFAAFSSINSEMCSFDIKNIDSALLAATRRHVQSVLFKCDWEDFLPSHGPGASTSSKWNWEHWYSSIDEVFPYLPYFFLNEDHAAVDLPLTDEITCKVVAVPKDSRGPRLVCVHPAEAIWAQQGARRVLERAINSRRPRSQGYPWPTGHINFDDQTKNGKIALLSSLSRRYATIDLSEASDRLSESLVAFLFGRYYKHFACSRARTYHTGDATMRLRMGSYAPMGNATVFPVQSLVFWAICVASLQKSGCNNPGAVFVFGDDIIVPSSRCYQVCEDLENFGLKVNRRKTFYNGHFRESCGVDAYLGVNVTPLRWKTVPSPIDLVGLVASCNLAMRLRIAGYKEAATHLYAYIRCALQFHHGLRLVRTNNKDHAGIAEYTESSSEAFEDSKWSRRWQWFYAMTYGVKPAYINHAGSGWNHILDSLVSLERSGRGSDRPEHVSRHVRLTREWTPVQ